MILERRIGPLMRHEVERIIATGKSLAIIYSPASPPKNSAEASATVFAALWQKMGGGK